MPSARSAAAAPRRRVRTSPPPRGLVARGPISRVRWDRVGRVGLLVVLAVVVGLYVQHTLAYFSTRSMADEQQAIVSRLERENAGLTREQQSLNDWATIQRDARALGMVMPGERPYVVTGTPGH